jgi:hypothetical protein
MPLFEPKESKLARQRAETHVAIQTGRNSVNEYINNCNSVSKKYLGMAKKGLRLGQRPQAAQYVATQIQYQNQADKWESFVLKIDDIALRGAAMQAMGGLMHGVSQLTNTITRGLSSKEVQKTMVNLQQGMFKVDQAEQTMSNALGSLSINVGPDTFEANCDSVPEEIKEQVSSVLDSLMDEVQLEEANGSGAIGASTSNLKANGADRGAMKRIDANLAKLQKFKKGNNGR